MGGAFDLFDSGAPKQIEGLKEKTDLLVSNGGEPIFIQGANILTVEEIRHGVRCVETSDDIHQGGLAGARGPEVMSPDSSSTRVEASFMAQLP